LAYGLIDLSFFYFLRLHSDDRNRGHQYKLFLPGCSSSARQQQQQQNNNNNIVSRKYVLLITGNEKEQDEWPVIQAVMLLCFAVFCSAVSQSVIQPLQPCPSDYFQSVCHHTAITS